MKVRTRIAPSPTGYPHIGTIYQAMFDFVMAKKYQGEFIVRIEDTDRSRFVKDAEEIIFAALDWFGLYSNENPIKGGPFAPYRQSERLDIYKKYANELLEKKLAYRCFCTKDRLDEMRKKQAKMNLPPMYDRHCLNLPDSKIQGNLNKDLPFTVRMQIPKNQKIKVKDSLAGEVEFDSNLIDDQIILKSDSFPTYHLAVVVDDYLMQITHVIRGKEWLPSTPKHILLYQYFGWEDSVPYYTHLPVILNSDGQGKLSKRDNHACVDYYKQEGFLPEAILNYLSNIVWNHPDGKEIYDLAELESAIDVDSPKIINVTSAAPRFNLKKLEWVNGEYIRKMSDQELTKRLDNFLVDHPAPEKIAQVVPLIKERIKKLSDFVPLTDFLFNNPEYDKSVFVDVLGDKSDQVVEMLNKVLANLMSLSHPWQADTFEQTFRNLAASLELSVSTMFQLIRVAISGQKVTPPLFESIMIIGEDETVTRIKWLIENFKELE